jgi:hypothetical protein
MVATPPAATAIGMHSAPAIIAAIAILRELLKKFDSKRCGALHGILREACFFFHGA